MRLLIAEGSPILRKRLIRLFSDLGFISLVAFVEELAEVHKTAREENPDVIVIDLNFPSLTSLKLLATLKAEIIHSQIIVITETLEARYIRQFQNSGADMVFHKENDLNTFIGHLSFMEDVARKNASCVMN